LGGTICGGGRGGGEEARGGGDLIFPVGVTGN
jgi:hypothetical protein